MVCSRCGHSVLVDAGRCSACGAAVERTGVATDVTAADTTGLPPNATFGGSTGGVTRLPLDATFDGVTGGVTVAVGTAAAPGATETDARSRAAAGPLQVGQSFGLRYHIIKLLGLGGMGAVYQAWDAELSVAVALKVIRVDRGRGAVSPEAEKRFKNELLLARQVTHKNVVRIHDLGEIGGIKYITMPYVQGDDLKTVLHRDGKLPIARALHVARQIAAGLDAAHEAGVVHRDLKPANIMIGAEDHAQIMDFGISASTEEAASGGVIGTLEYMAPEQGTGAVVDARADIYAFGLIIHEMLIGPRPAPSGRPQDRIEAMRQRFEQGLPAVRALDESIPIVLDAFVTRCLDRDPAARFQTTAELSGALAALDGQGELIPIPARVSKRMVAAAAALVVVLLVSTYIVTRRAVLPPKQHDPISVVIADLQNLTNDPTFDRTLAPVLKRALEGAGFISAYDRNGIRGTLGVRPPERLDEVAAREIAVKQGLGVVLSGSIDRQGNGYGVSLKAAQTVTGAVIATAKGRASNKDQVLGVVTKLVTAVRKALGDDTSDSAQLFAMASVSAISLEVLRHYAAAREASSNGKFDEARRSYSKAVELDPKFGMGYQGLAAVSQNLGNLQDAEKYIKEALRYLDSMTERERYTVRGAYYKLTGDYQQCVKENAYLIARYAADVVARNNLALCSTFLRDMPRALDEMRRLVELLPKRVVLRDNLALYANYAGDFQTGEKEARTIQEPDAYALLALAFAQLGQGRLPQAMETYQKLGTIGALGGSFAASGLGDLATLEGRFSDAVRILDQGAVVDLASKNPDRAAAKFASLAYAHLLRGRKGPAVAAAEKALANSKAVKIRFLAARVFVDAGEIARARPLIAGLASELQAEPQAYAKIVEGEVALKNGDARQAIKVLIEANGLLDTWIGHFDLGRAYLEAGQFPQADSELDRCTKRRGEALSLFLDEEPTYAYLPPVYYYQGRVREGLNSAGFAESYRNYLSIRGQSTEDPLLAEVRRRSGR